MTTEYFTSKDDYLLYRSQFTAAVNHNNAKPRLERSDEWLRNSDTFSEGTGTNRVNGWMTATHYILHNILRGKPPKRGFTPITNTRKLEGVPNKWVGFNCGYNNLIRLSKIAKIVVSGKSPAQSWQRDALLRFLTPLLTNNEDLYEKYVTFLANMQLDEQND